MLREFLARLKERKVVRVAVLYAVAGYATFQVANNLLTPLGLPRWTVTLVLVLYLLGFPIALIMAYAFEQTPEGLKRSSGPASPGTQVTWLDYTLLVAAAVVIGITILQFARTPRDRVDVPAVAQQAAARAQSAETSASAAGEPQAKTIAVLPFVNFGDTRDGEYFADGLTEELINSLAQLPNLHVAGRTSAFYFKGRNEDLREIGRKLGVAHVLEGSVRRSGDNLRITAQLISVADGFHLWSQTYDRAASDAFQIQTQISQAVAQTLKSRFFGPGPRSPEQRDPRAYELELLARSHLRKQEAAELQRARTLFQELIRLEPENARAHTGFAEATILLAQNFIALDFPQALRESAAAVTEALRLEPRSSEAWRTRGLLDRIQGIRTNQQANVQSALRAFQRAVELDPRDSESLAMYGNQLLTLGQYEQAAVMLRRALEIDPLSRTAPLLLAYVAKGQQQYAQARRQFEDLLVLYPDYTNARIALGELLRTQGKLDEVVTLLDDPATRRADPLATLMIANVYANLDMQQELRTLLHEVREPPTVVALARAIELQRSHQWADLQTLSRRTLAETDDPVWSSLALVAAVLAGDVPGMRVELQNASAPLLATPPVLDANTAVDGMIVAEALRRTGSTAQAATLLAALQAKHAELPADPNVDMLRVRALLRASTGNVQGALADLELAEKKGYRDLVEFDYFIRLDEYPWMSAVTREPRYRAMVQRIERDHARMREALRATKRPQAVTALDQAR